MIRFATNPYISISFKAFELRIMRLSIDIMKKTFQIAMTQRNHKKSHTRNLFNYHILKSFHENDGSHI